MLVLKIIASSRMPLGTPGTRSWEHGGMAMREIRIIGDPVLRTPCEPITTVDARVRSLVTDLLETVDAEGRAGLSANQIGVSLRAFAWNIDDEIGYVLNPRIVELSEDEYQDGDEGCLSVPGLWFPTTRAWYARVVGEDVDRKPVVVEGTELMARALQHEVDHLDGKLFLDRLERSVRKRAMRTLREQLG
jgi:peptide deformylase